MPLNRCESDGNRGWRWGSEGKCYTGPNARRKAIEQALAMGDGEINKKLDELNEENTMSFWDWIIGKTDDDEMDDTLKRYFSLDALDDASDEEVRNIFGNMSVRYLRLRERAEELLEELQTRGAELPENTALFQVIESVEVDKADESVSDDDEGDIEKDVDSQGDEDDENGETTSKSDDAEGDEDQSDDLEDLRKSALGGRGDSDATVMFVGASPSRLDTIRKKVYSGPVGKTLQETYLSELSTESVYLTNAVPVFLSDEDGNPREPNDQEIAKWAPILQEEIEQVRPRFIVALGKTAREALGDAVDEFVPHPRGVNIYGDSGEVARKLSRLDEAVEKSQDQEATESLEFDVMKSNDEQQVVYGVVYEPRKADTDGNWTTTDEIERAAHYFMKNFRLVGHEHKSIVKDAYPVESYIAPVDFEMAGQTIKQGTWVAAIKIEDEERWNMVKSGEYSGFSIGAKAKIDPEKRLDTA